MKVLIAALAALLLMAICSSAEVQLSDSRPAASLQNPGTNPILCCLTYTTIRISRRLIQDAYVVSSKCHMPAVVLVTKKGKNICVNPEEAWVNKYLNASRH